MPAPRYPAVSASTRSAAVPPPSASSAARADCSSVPGTGRPPRAACHRSSTASAPTYASRQPAGPHRQRPAAVDERGVAPLAGAAARAREIAAVADHGRADAGADQRDHGVPGAPAGAEPHLGLAEGLGAVVHEQRQRQCRPAASRSSGTASQPMVWRVHQRRRRPARRCRARRRRCRAPLGRDRRPARSTSAEPVADLRDDRRPGPGRADGSGWSAVASGQRQVEQLDPHAGLADVDADQVAEAGVDAQQHARPAPVGLDLAGLDDQPLGSTARGHRSSGRAR